MVKRKRAGLAIEAERYNREQLSRLGGLVRASRLRRRLIQRQLGECVGLSPSTISALELGQGGGLSVDAWQRVALALN
jgi:transcriptional regulator with XRE-family HTH domain